MAQGLDELVEWLVGEISFYGDGKSIFPSSPVALPVHAAYPQLDLLWVVETVCSRLHPASNRNKPNRRYGGHMRPS